MAKRKWPYRFTPKEMDEFAGNLHLRCIEARLWHSYAKEAKRQAWSALAKKLEIAGYEPIENVLVAAERTGYLPQGDIDAIRIVRSLSETNYAHVKAYKPKPPVRSIGSDSAFLLSCGIDPSGT
jgi:hypothetical protein